MPKKAAASAPVLTREILLKLLEFQRMDQEGREDFWEEMFELQHEHMTAILGLALCSFERFVPPLTIQTTAKGLEIIVGFPAVAPLTEGQEYP